MNCDTPAGSVYIAERAQLLEHDWIQWLRWVGPATKLAAIGRTHRATRTAIDGTRVDAEVPDSIAIVADLECGATGNYHLSSAASSVPPQTIAIYGSKGALVYDLFGGQIMGATDGAADLAPVDIPEAEVRAIAENVARYEPAKRVGTESSAVGSELQLTDFGNAQRLVRDHGDRLRYLHAAGQWLTSNGRCWVRDDVGLPMQLAKQ